MKKAVIIFLCLFLSTLTSFSQTKKTPIKSPVKPPIKTSSPIITELSESEWKELTKVLEAENWEQLSLLSADALKKIKLENDKKQLARLRYFYLYALAGKVSQGKMTNAELQNIAQTFVGKNFIMLDRNVLSDCNKSLNYVCPLKYDNQALRVTATNKAFTTIYSQESVALLQEFDFVENNNKNVFVGGILRNVELNPAKDKVWIMRLSFDNGWVQAVDKK